MVTSFGSSSSLLIGFGSGPAPPYLVESRSIVFSYPSNWRGKFFAHSAGSTVFSSSSATLKPISRASAIRVEMLA